MQLELKGISKSYHSEAGGKMEVLSNLNLDIPDGSFTSIMGPSGCGKTTLLNIIAGLVDMDEGTIAVEGEEITPDELPYAYVFQEPRLLNWLTVGENIRFALKADGVSASRQDDRIHTYLDMVGLAGDADKYPRQLSGGMLQRVGLARALSVEKDLLLMDEPFSALDELTARNLRKDVLDLWQQTDKTITFITHNLPEAIYLSDKIYFLDQFGELFMVEDIDLERPRSPHDEELKQLEANLMDRFLTHLDSYTSNA